MSWKDTLLDASFRGRQFHCVGTSDRAERGVALHEYPFRDGGEGDDMGRKARRCTIRAVFFGDSYEGDLARFVEALDKGGEGELVHPVFGVMPALVLDYALEHDPENTDRCDVTVSFVESGQKNTFFSGARTALGRSERAGNDLDSAGDALRGAAGLGLSSWVREHLSGLSLSERLDASDSMTSVLFGLNDAAGAETSLVDYLDFPEALVSDMEAVAYSASALAGFDSSDSAGRFRGWRRLSDLFPGRSTSRTGASRSYATSRTSYVGSSSSSLLPTAAAPDLSTAAGQAYAVTVVLLLAMQTAVVAEAVSDLLVAEASNPTLCPAEVEAVVGNTRERIQDCLDASRQVLPTLDARPIIEAGRDMALAVQTLGLEVINLMPPLIPHEVDSPCNVHLLAHRLYGDYSRAAEIMRLNPGISAPNFLARGLVVNVYAE